MSILIKGMDMPKNCEECRFDAGGYCTAKSINFLDWSNVDDQPKPSWCPLIEIPDVYIDMSKAFMTELANKVCIKGEEDG